MGRRQAATEHEAAEEQQLAPQEQLLAICH
jgi:hypothetical protein